ncbi:MAG TPA: hypothetical protein VHU16_00600 [Candidatus Udaeobacter sp.]|nr:hypothetical protein [Candidatus Udaeobacter sp.]
MLHKIVLPATGLVKLIAAESRTLMDKSRSSRKQQYWLFRRHYLLVLSVISWTIALWPHPASAITLSHADAQTIGKRIWQNECNGTISGLTAWNQGEDFASLGIGHFIWYPSGRRGPFEESFPKVVSFISKRGAKLPTLLLRGVEQPCPWNSRSEFLRAQHTVEMNQLRQFLVDTIDLQAEFLIARLEGALPKMLAEAAPTDRANVQQQFERLARTPHGCYALVDYVNFKGEGVLHTERYQGQGWGLLQVLESMHGTSDAAAVDEFSSAAKAILTRRVHNAPAQRYESRWLTGWIRRVNSYSGS